MLGAEDSLISHFPVNQTSKRELSKMRGMRDLGYVSCDCSSPRVILTKTFTRPTHRGEDPDGGSDNESTSSQHKQAGESSLTLGSYVMNDRSKTKRQFIDLTVVVGDNQMATLQHSQVTAQVETSSHNNILFQLLTEDNQTQRH